MFINGIRLIHLRKLSLNIVEVFSESVCQNPKRRKRNFLCRQARWGEAGCVWHHRRSLRTHCFGKTCPTQTQMPGQYLASQKILLKRKWKFSLSPIKLCKRARCAQTQTNTDWACACSLFLPSHTHVKAACKHLQAAFLCESRLLFWIKINIIGACPWSKPCISQVYAWLVTGSSQVTTSSHAQIEWIGKTNTFGLQRFVAELLFLGLS